MAQVILGSLGQAVGLPMGQVIGSTIGRMIDQTAVAGLESPRRRGPRLEALQVQGTAEGAPMACVFGRVRVAGHVIWAARFLESRHTSSGGKGGPRSVEYGYSLSFALALCEGEIDGVGRVWADGRPMDVTGVTMRVHRGGLDQTPDPLIEAVEGQAPAYRGVAYVVFEDLPLAPFGNRLPQLSFEVFRRPKGERVGLEDRLEGVCLIPGAGEFVLATQAVFRREGLTRTSTENVHGYDGRTDLVASLDQLQTIAPNLKRVSLVIGWFGSDLRAAHCRIRPGVETSDKSTEPLRWSVAGLDRGDAHLISDVGGAPAYGGTPSDESVRQAVAELKARGLKVTLYPFVFMDVPAGNGLPDPYGGAEQAAYPWRGRLVGRDGHDADEDVASIFGPADGWGLRRLALHYAALAAETGANGLLIGSEMRGLTGTRDVAGAFPAVDQLRMLAAECRAVTGPSVKLSYAADWSEYSGWRNGSDLIFHLDPLWADPAIDFVGIDWYPPIGDWRDGDGGLDGADYEGPHDRAYLASQINGGEGFDWFYASEADRAAQLRTAIVDTACGEDWVFRPKDLRSWWRHAHHDRPGGVRSSTPTAWAPEMKPIRLTEFGCAAVDRGGNAPNLFQDPKSAEDALPPFSTGARDDRVQRRAVEAVLQHFETPGNNPISMIYGGPMLEAADAWCWDARPWPAFPARGGVWADAGSWRTGHWLNGRLGGETRNIISALLARGGLGDDVLEIGAFEGEAQGYVVDRPMRLRDALEPLLTGLGLIASEQDGRIVVRGSESPAVKLEAEDLALPEEGFAAVAERVLEARPSQASVRYINGDQDYQTGAATLRSGDFGGVVEIDLPAVCSAALAETAAERALEGAAADRLTVRLGPLAGLRLEPGDMVSLAWREGLWRVMRIDTDETPLAVLEPVSGIRLREDRSTPVVGDRASIVASPFFRMIDLPPLPGSEDDARPIVVVAADPWRPLRIFGGVQPDALTTRAEVETPATVGSLTKPLAPGVVGRWDRANALTVRIEGRAPESRTSMAVFAGGNLIAVETIAGWEIIQFRQAVLQEDGGWRLSDLLRGQQGSEAATAAGAAPGALVVVLDAAPPRAATSESERGLPLLWRAAPVGGPAGGPGVSGTTFSWEGVHGRPWRPAHLRSKPTADGGFGLSWIPRTRLAGDRLDGEPLSSDPNRFRVRVLSAGATIRMFETTASTATYSAALAAADFLEGVGVDARIAVAQWGDGFGWGGEAQTTLVAA